MVVWPCFFCMMTWLPRRRTRTKPCSATTLPPAQRGLRLGQPQQRVPPVAIFAAALLLSAVGLIPVQIAFVAAVVILIMGKFVSLREAYASVD